MDRIKLIDQAIFDVFILTIHIHGIKSEERKENK